MPDALEGETTVESPRLSALVVAHNEENNLPDCLAAIAFADEVVVVLDRCTDASKAIAESMGARTIEGAWEIEGVRRNLGIDSCTGDWIFEVDADERVPPELAAEVRDAIRRQKTGYFLIPFDNYIGDTLVRHGWGGAWGVSATVRLFARGCKRWGMQRVHPSVTLAGPRGRLQARMIHRVDRNISDMLMRLDRYTTARAADLRQSGSIGRLGPNVRRIFSRFYKCYVARRGYREGHYGFLIALMAGLYPVLSFLKARLEDERERRPGG